VAGVCEGPRIKVAEAYSLFSEYPREGIKVAEAYSLFSEYPREGKITATYLLLLRNARQLKGI